MTDKTPKLITTNQNVRAHYDTALFRTRSMSRIAAVRNDQFRLAVGAMDRIDELSRITKAIGTALSEAPIFASKTAFAAQLMRALEHRAGLVQDDLRKQLAEKDKEL